MDEKDLQNVAIPVSLFKKIEERIKKTEFQSVSAYVTYVLQEAVSETERTEQKQVFSAEEEESVKDRLRALGYI